jgi:hypothetical protein
MQTTAGLINELISLALLTYFSLLLSGKIKLRPDQQIKFNAFMQRRRKLFKVLAYAGTAVFTVLVARSIFLMTGL